MTPRPYLLVLLLAATASAQTRGKATVEVPQLPASGVAGSAVTAPVLPAASLTLSPSASLTPAALPAAVLPAAPVVPAAAAAAAPIAATAKVSPVASHAAARAQLGEVGARIKAEDADAGREAFDGGLGGKERGAVLAASGGADPLEKPTPRAAQPKPSIPLRQRASETAELGAMTLGLSFLGAILLGLAKTFGGSPWIGGAFWGMAGSALLGHLGDMRSIVVGGWQASHDQKYRVDPNTGNLRDVRGHKYGEDRYEERRRGPVSRTETAVLESVSFVSGLGLQALIWGADAKSLALYAAGFAGAFLARLALKRLKKPAPEFVPSEEDKSHAARFRH